MFVRCLSGRWVDGEVASSSGTLGFVATLAERIKRILRTSSRPLDDDELAGRLGVIRQAVNQVCRRLEAQGLVRREVGPYNKIVNTLVDVAARGGAAVRPTQAPVSVGPVSVSQDLDQPIGEDAVKAAVRDFLVARGMHVEVRWGRDRGVDITATGADERWIVEAKGGVLSPQQQGNYFLGPWVSWCSGWTIPMLGTLWRFLILLGAVDWCDAFRTWRDSGSCSPSFSCGVTGL